MHPEHQIVPMVEVQNPHLAPTTYADLKQVDPHLLGVGFHQVTVVLQTIDYVLVLGLALG
jgi:hypothetical protein